MHGFSLATYSVGPRFAVKLPADEQQGLACVTDIRCPFIDIIPTMTVLAHLISEVMGRIIA